ncbi:hypothetical protein SCA6_020546 [Theobroma cacao]
MFYTIFSPVLSQAVSGEIDKSIQLESSQFNLYICFFFPFVDDSCCSLSVNSAVTLSTASQLRSPQAALSGPALHAFPMEKARLDRWNMFPLVAMLLIEARHHGILLDISLPPYMVCLCKYLQSRMLSLKEMEARGKLCQVHLVS